MADIDINSISEALNDKLDRDFNNPATAGKERCVGWNMPDYSTTIDVTTELYNNLQYTAPTNGILYNAMIPQTETPIKINGYTVGTRRYSTYGNWIPTPYILNKGDVFSVTKWISSDGGAFFVSFKEEN